MPRADRPLRIDIAVHGRFHAFHLARELLAKGHDVRLLTNYPKRIVARFGIPPQHVESYLWHGLLTRLYYRLFNKLGLPDWDPLLHRKFGRWAAKRVRRDGDALYIFSGVAEEILRALGKDYPGVKMLVRGSAHIRIQHGLLADEETRCGIAVDKPSDWIVAREEREYALADKVVVLSSFARDSFLAQGFSADKILLSTLGVDTRRFKPLPGVLETRINRVKSGAPLRILMVGTFSPQKGAWDLIRIARSMHGRMQFRFVGDVPDGSAALHRQAQGLVEFIPRVPEFELPKQYAWGDIFCFPTIQDGYAVVLAQALTACLPVLTTPNCSAPDIVRDDVNGWILPIRSPDSFISRLDWCDKNRDALSKIIETMSHESLTRDWSEVAEHFEICLYTIFSLT
jgi:glycosyltransferase involved in cell wall biosynthesis